MNLRPKTLRARVAIATAGVLVVVLGVVALIVDDAVRRHGVRSMDGALRVEAEAIASTIRLDGAELELEMGERATLSRYATPRAGAYFEIVANGRPPIRSASLAGASLVKPSPGELGPEHVPASAEVQTSFEVGPHEARVRTCRLRLSVPVTVEGEEDPRPGAKVEAVIVEVARSSTEIDASRAAVRNALSLALPIGLLLGAIAAYLVAGRATLPLRRLSEEAGSIGEDSPDARLDASRVEGELRDLTDTLNQAFDRVSALAARERRFAADAAHELRTPIAILRSHLELSLSRERTPDESRSTMQTALDATLRLDQIVRALLLLGRLEGGRLQTTSLDVRDVVRRAVEALRPAAERAGARIETSFPTGTVDVRGDGVLLERLVSNLVENALSHGGGDVLAALSVDAVDARLVVSDRGPGFAAELSPRLFERFARGDASRTRATGGAGLGLSIARAIARAHGGDVTATSREGGGASVVVRLPLAPSAGVDVSESRS